MAVAAAAAAEAAAAAAALAAVVAEAAGLLTEAGTGHQVLAIGRR